MKPTSAIVAVTLNCNSRCVMCDIWKQSHADEMLPEGYLKLPASLREINLSGGEPFLRRDLLAIISAIRQACPQARLVISTNGLLLERIHQLAPQLSQMGRSVAIRISMDGMAATHDRVRGVPQSFSRVLQGLQALREAGVADLGIGMTVLSENVTDVGQVYQVAEDLGIEFSLTIVSESPIFFGDDKSRLRPPTDALVEQLRSLITKEYCHRQPKRWFRAWFEKGLVRYALEARRPLPCDAGQGFFYMDPYGAVYGCHMLPDRLGTLREESWETIWQSSEAQRARQNARECQSCWMVCTARTQMSKSLIRIGPQILSDKIKAHISGGRGEGGQYELPPLRNLPR